MAQTSDSWELLVIDGASTDGSQRIIQGFADRIAFWTSEPDKGVYAAWNKAVARARGTWIVFLGADDTFSGPTVLAEASPALHAADGVFSVAYGSLRTVDARGAEVEVLGLPWPEARTAFRDRMTLQHPAVFHHRSLFERHGMFDERFRIAGDYEYLLRELPVHDAVFIPGLVVVNMAVGGLSSDPRNLVLVETEVQKARRMHGLRRGPAQLAPSVLRLRAKLAIDRAFGPRVGAASVRTYHALADPALRFAARFRGHRDA